MSEAGSRGALTSREKLLWARETVRTIEHSLQRKEVRSNWHDGHGEGEAEEFVDHISVIMLA